MTTERQETRDRGGPHAAPPAGEELRDKVSEWAEANRERVGAAYDAVGPFDIDNDRMADLLLPLQAVAAVVDGIDALDAFPQVRRGGLTGTLRQYAKYLDERGREQEAQSPGVRLLAACREILREWPGSFLPTAGPIKELAAREEEPWAHYSHGRAITPHALGDLLRPYGIKSERNVKQTARGYTEASFGEAWERYLPPLTLGKASKASSPSNEQPDPVIPPWEVFVASLNGEAPSPLAARLREAFDG
jgi:hypothetical protein